jgi:hypothetical protein
MIERLTNSKGLSKDYKAGLAAAKKEYDVLAIQKKMAKEPKAPPQELRKDESFKKGFNIGYRLADQKGFAIENSKTTNERYSKYLDGMKAGALQHNYDLEKLQEKHPNAKLFANDPKTAPYEAALLDHKVTAMDDISREQYGLLDKKEAYPASSSPKWMDDRTSDKTTPEPDKDMDLDRDR